MTVPAATRRRLQAQRCARRAQRRSGPYALSVSAAAAIARSCQPVHLQVLWPGSGMTVSKIFGTGLRTILMRAPAPIPVSGQRLERRSADHDPGCTALKVTTGMSVSRKAHVPT
jgi:hypothetical protein